MQVCKTRGSIEVYSLQVPEDPFYFCGECFKEFNYDAEGKKKCDFRAYNYIQPHAL